MKSNAKDNSKCTFQGMCNDVKRFLDNNPKEIIILDFKYFLSIGSMFNFKEFIWQVNR